jgi:DNA anti-recombination protein RmuC
MAETTVTLATEQPTNIVEIPAAGGAAEMDEYQWLTERLDAHTRELTESRQLMQSQMEAIREANRTQAEQSNNLVTQLSQMVQTMSETLTALAASALLRSTQSNSEITSTEPEPEVIVQTNPESVAEGSREQRTEPPPEVRRRRKL